MNDSSFSLTVSPLGRSVLQTLLYFDIFNYPLTLQEIYTFSGSTIASLDILEKEVSLLEKAGLIFRFNQFYSIQGDNANITRRVKGNSEAEKYIPMALQRARLFTCFPFVRAVMASGSLSKGYMDERSDLDFFIVTEPNRLWMARTLLVLYRKIFIPRKRYKEFCINYFITSDKLEIEEKNLFTATELATLLPLGEPGMYHKLMAANPWVRDYLPNLNAKKNPGSIDDKAPLLKRILEKVLSFSLGNRVERLLMETTLKRFKRKYGKHFENSQFALAFKSKPHVSKAHLGNNQTRVLSRLQEKIREFEARFTLAFTHV